MRHLGDITKISGYTAPIVDCIVGGSPCQDLSVAGKRDGLAGERSGLFMDQIRIVKEMRHQDELDGNTGVHIRPRYMVWENVPGAFSSNGGQDFQTVLEEIAKVADKDAVISRPKDGKWTNCGCIVADSWSIAWRVLDAQFWGVPQRRRRIALVADFGGQSAPEILFVRQSLSGDSKPSESKRKDSSSHASRGIGADDSERVRCYDIGEARLRTPSEYKDLSPTLSARCGTGGNNTPAVITKATAYTMQDREGCAGGGKGALIQEDISASLRCNNFQYVFQPITYSKSKRAQSNTDYESWQESDTANTLNAFDTGDVRTTEAVVYAIGNGQANQSITEEQAGALNCMHDQQAVLIASVDCRNGTEDTVNGALQSNSAHSLNGNNVVRTRYIVRRLTPLECERLQGYPDGWTDIGEYIDSNGKKRKISDAARYKALGNSIALPPWKWVLKRLCACYERDATMASLFDGIGGFPYLWEQLNGKGTCLWASEIEEFPMAVTKARIG